MLLIVLFSPCLPFEQIYSQRAYLIHFTVEEHLATFAFSGNGFGFPTRDKQSCCNLLQSSGTSVIYHTVGNPKTQRPELVNSFIHFFNATHINPQIDLGFRIEEFWLQMFRSRFMYNPNTTFSCHSSMCLNRRMQGLRIGPDMLCSMVYRNNGEHVAVK